MPGLLKPFSYTCAERPEISKHLPEHRQAKGRRRGRQTQCLQAAMHFLHEPREWLQITQPPLQSLQLPAVAQGGILHANDNSRRRGA
jgi:hypothetical protein